MSRKKDLERGAHFLVSERVRLANCSFKELSELPSFTELAGPADMPRLKYGLYRDLLPDGSVRVVIQQIRPLFLGISNVKCAGFYMTRQGEILELRQEDVWDFT